MRSQHKHNTSLPAGSLSHVLAAALVPAMPCCHCCRCGGPGRTRHSRHSRLNIRLSSGARRWLVGGANVLERAVAAPAVPTAPAAAPAAAVLPSCAVPHGGRRHAGCVRAGEGGRN